MPGEMKAVWPTQLKFTSIQDELCMIVCGGVCVGQEADMAMASIGITPRRHKVVDFTFPHWYELSVVAITLSTNNWTYFIKPLSPSLFLLYFSLPLVLGLVLWVFEQWHHIIIGSSQPCRDKGSGQGLVGRLWDIVYAYIQNIYSQGVYLTEQLHPQCVFFGQLVQGKFEQLLLLSFLK